MNRIDADLKYAKLVEHCDSLIKVGKMSAVASQVSRLNTSQVPRAHRQALAKICRRAGQFGHGLALLHPIIRNEKEKIDPATPAEICEYALLLSRNGSVGEALTLLEGIDDKSIPDLALHRAFCLIMNWDYGRAAGFLESHLTSPTDSYSKLIARVNLVAAHLALAKWEEAARLLDETLPLAEEAGASRLVANCLELRSRLHLNQKNYSRSESDLDRALGIIGEAQSFDRLLINKWQAIIESLRTGSLAPLERFRPLAVEGRQWESVREIDLYSLKIRFEQEKLDHLVIGTPMPSYRERIGRETGAKPSSSCVFGRSPAPCLDLSSGEIAGAKFSPGKKLHQLIVALLGDFYVPANMGTLFAKLYPSEHFDINSSPMRVRQVVQRTRQWLKENSLPARIEQSDGAYRFVIEGEFGVRVYLAGDEVSSASLSWRQLREAFPTDTEFTAKEACDRLAWPRSSFLLVVRTGLDAGELEKTGEGKATRYRVVSRSGKQSRAA